MTAAASRSAAPPGRGTILAMVAPSSSTEPVSGRRRRASARSRVDFPDPFGPMMAVTLPAPKWKAAQPLWKSGGNIRYTCRAMDITATAVLSPELLRVDGKRIGERVADHLPTEIFQRGSGNRHIVHRLFVEQSNESLPIHPPQLADSGLREVEESRASIRFAKVASLAGASWPASGLRAHLGRQQETR